MKHIEFPTGAGKVQIEVGYQPIDGESVLLKAHVVTIPKLLKGIPFFDIPDTFDKVVARQELLELSDHIRAVANDQGEGVAHE